ncbi:MAG: bifunctional salicylyl-CoA 5-hydroxylase/oxidoreductase, partial [Actinomycetota bacterium]
PALIDYEMERQPLVERFQEAARESATYFENVRRYSGFEPMQFAFNLLTRSGRITHLELEKRDPVFVRSVDGWFAAAATAERGDHRAAAVRIAPPPLFATFRLRGVDLANRVAISPISEDDAEEGALGSAMVDRVRAAAAQGVGLVLTEMIAVSAHARINPGTPGLYSESHAEAWRKVVDAAHSEGTAIAAVLGHAGPRGGTRRRREGVDRPLRGEGWPLLAASSHPFTPSSAVPHELTDEMGDVVEDFVTATRFAADAGFDLIEVHSAQGYLLASFLSPLMNHRTDGFGGSLPNRLRYPLRVVDAVRAEWPSDRALSVALLATDWARGGFDLDDAVAAATALRDHGCDVVRPLAGQTSVRAVPNYGRFHLVPASDRIRNEAGVATLVGGNLTTADEANTVLAAGRADLCQLELAGDA